MRDRLLPGNSRSWWPQGLLAGEVLANEIGALLFGKVLPLSREQLTDSEAGVDRHVQQWEPRAPPVRLGGKGEQDVRGEQGLSGGQGLRASGEQGLRGKA